ncbi:MAG: histidinol-phosphatase HisJ family protein [Clostridia bacterium]|nr:histidinol-phosphatase HisJ family protein [Clostridia bacterium]
MKLARTDYHIHPNYSIDASPIRIKDYCFRALELGLVEICFTTHVEIDPVRREIDNYVALNGEKIPVLNLAWLDNYFDEITKAQEAFKTDSLKIKAGIEIGYCQGVEKDIEIIVGNYPFDFVLGAIHCLDHIAISSLKESPNYYKTRSLATMRADYFTTLKEAVTSGFFDCIAHLDLYRRYGFKHYGPEILTIHRGVIEPIFEEMARRGMGLEINTSSRRRGLKEFHPAKEIVALAAKAGVKIFTVGSDAHSLEQLGDYIDEALAFLKQFKLTNHVYSQRRAIPCL